MKNNLHQPLLLFDGVCNLCNSSVQKIIKRDTHNQFKFASLQSDASKEILLHFSNYNSSIDSIILIYNDKAYLKSSAILGVCKVLGGLYNVLLIFWLIPKPIRDACYDLIARNRYKWFGKRVSCMIPSEEISSKFLD